MFKVYRQPEQGELFCVGADTSVGGTDYCAVQFLSLDRLDVPIVYHKKIIATSMTNDLYPFLNKLSDITNVAPIVAYERNNGGAFEMERLASLNREAKYDVFRMPQFGTTEGLNQTIKYGWDTNTATRPVMLGNLKECIDNRLLTIYDEQTINEMFSFVVMQTSTAWKAQAESGAHDDLIMSLAIAWQIYLNKPQRREMYVESYRPAKRYDRVTGRLLS